MPRGATVVDESVENDAAVSSRSRTARPLYATILERARSGQYDVIVAYSNCRLTRRPGEWDEFIDLYEQHA